LLEGCPIVARGTLIPRRALVVSEPFGRELDAGAVAAALARGLQRGGAPAPDLCPLPGAPRGGRPAERLAELLAGERFDARMLDSRALVVAARALEPRTLAGSLAFEVATRARQNGVPCYAVTAHDRIDSFDARVLDLQVVLETVDARALARAGRTLAAII
jgi:hypothetical protein